MIYPSPKADVGGGVRESQRTFDKSILSMSESSSKQQRTVVVTGDACIDWLSIPVDPLLANKEGIANWQLRRGRHMYAERGGAWLTADLTEQAIGGRAEVIKPQDFGNLAIIPPEDLVHSMLMLKKYDREREKETVQVWAVQEPEGFAGPPDGQLPSKPPKPISNPANADIVVLDDAGNSFRNDDKLWPSAITTENQHPIVVY